MVIFLILIVIAVKTNNHPMIIDKEFLPFFHNFKEDSKKYNRFVNFSNLTTVFVENLPENELAYCIPALKTVKVSRDEWNRGNYLYKKLVLYHEWGHCVLNRDHKETSAKFSEDSSNCPSSIMYPYIDPIISCYLKNTKWYDEELFTDPLNDTFL